MIKSTWSRKLSVVSLLHNTASVKHKDPLRFFLQHPLIASEL